MAQLQCNDDVNEGLAQLIAEMTQEDDEDTDEEIDYHDEDDNIADIADIRGRRVAAIYRANILDKTRCGYHRSVAKFVLWLFHEGKQVYLHQDLLAALNHEAATTHPKLMKVAKLYINKASTEFHPVALDMVTSDNFLDFLLSLRPEGQFLSRSAYGAYRSGLFDLYRECGVEQTGRFHLLLTKGFQGLKRKAQEYKQQLGTKLSEGKDPLPFPLYKQLCQWMIVDGSRESIFTWSFLTLTWNLICRSKNTTTIHRNHISWENDSLVIQFAHQKTDMIGQTEAVRRHVFANPKEPDICPILALSVYLAITPFRSGAQTVGALFGGNHQYERFRRNLLSLVFKHKEAIEEMGIDCNEVGVHSIRKGAATYACCGTTGAPSLASVCNRAGWTMGKVKDTYIRYEAASDQYVGRVVAGLDIHSFEFSISPPFFQSMDTDSALVKEDMQNVFPFVIETKHMLVMRFCLASLMHSKNFLLQHLGETSPVLRNSSLKADGLKSQFQWVRTKFAHDEIEPQLKICGIPPHVVVLLRIDTVL
jgi:hypothetical protein